MTAAMPLTPVKSRLSWVGSRRDDSGIRKTVQWYLDNLEWCRRVQDRTTSGERNGRLDCDRFIHEGSE